MKDDKGGDNYTSSQLKKDECTSANTFWLTISFILIFWGIAIILGLVSYS